MTEAKKILYRLLAKWRVIKISEILLFGVGVSVLSYFIFFDLWMAFVVLLGLFVIGFIYVKPWRMSLEDVCSYVDAHIIQMQNSTGLVLKDEKDLSVLAKIQQSKISKELGAHKGEVRFKNNLVLWLLFALGCSVAGVFLYSLGFVGPNSSNNTVPEDEVINFQLIDSVASTIAAPKIIEQKVSVQYPDYTNKSTLVTSKMNIEVLEGSRVNWKIRFDQAVKEVLLQKGDDSLSMVLNGDTYSASVKADYSDFYTFVFSDSVQNKHLSDLYVMEVYKDEPPIIRVEGLPQFSSFDYDGPQVLEFSAGLNDDFGVSAVAIVATVSKGTGESVKFREERLGFDTSFKKNSKNQNLRKKIDLRDLKMEPGDELYFYIEATDTKRPRPNIARTETYFSVVKDTVTDLFAVEGTLGADLMPDYFRSQRQLIIDTEKLISEKSKIEEKEFNYRSNELGFDQKSLRLKYGEFMGDETESAPAPAEINETSEEGNLLAGYTHDHDGANEHNLVEDEGHGHEHEHEHESDGDSEEQEDPLEAYVHNHEDPEASTLFANSLKSKLKQAMAEMWDAELYLRLFQPEKSLPYQYKALKLIQEIKNSARIYVHRIGFDPPPIKEDKRLTGDLKEIGNFTKEENLTGDVAYPYIKKAVARLEMLRLSPDVLMNGDRELFGKAGSELAARAIAEPGKYLNTLQELKWLSESAKVSVKQIDLVLRGLYDVLPDQKPLPSTKKGGNDKINELFIEALNVE
ncbi:tryptophan-rich sensory protein [Maribacter sp. MMG018]|uniref:tryptophan-rich sensory protein n=1 Tax=Maribacter sp. MMG018 TaxID=2822688 RepID=UPI001B36118F|nr:tryptophan-rich sensory protein [Maribacter sp. MMG018]MBQ4912952.1 tryptophan-rich sensory protein [Maribacter sp. MMG018]